MQVIWDKKYFLVTCRKCKVEEMMIFRNRFINLKKDKFVGPIRVPLFYKNQPYTCIDAFGKERTNIFKAIIGIFGDKFPEKCPLCDEILKKEKISFRF